MKSLTSQSTESSFASPGRKRTVSDDNSMARAIIPESVPAQQISESSESNSPEKQIPSGPLSPAPTTNTSAPITSPVPITNPNAPKSLDELLEAKMASDIYRANNNLKAFKQFRVTSEKYYQDKYSDEMKRREIREPLENALIENSLLKGKVQRRDEVIRSLRRFILIDCLRNSDSTTASQLHSTLQDFNKNEEYKELQISDENANLMKIIKNHEKEILKLKGVIQQQQISLKEYSDEIQKKDFIHQEIIRKYDNEREHHQTMIEKRDQRINRLCIDLENLQREKKELEEDFDQKIRDISKLEDRIQELMQQRENVNKMKDDYEDKIDDLKIEIREQKEENIIMGEKLADLQTRYDTLVIELDSMVQDGYRHSDAPPMLTGANSPLALSAAALETQDDVTAGGASSSRKSTAKKLSKVEKRVSSTKLKASQIHTAMKKHRDSTQTTAMSMLPDTLEESSSHMSSDSMDTHRSPQIPGILERTVSQLAPPPTNKALNSPRSRMPSQITPSNQTPFDGSMMTPMSKTPATETRKSLLFTSPTPALHGPQPPSPRNTTIIPNSTSPGNSVVMNQNLSSNSSVANIHHHSGGGMVASPSTSNYHNTNGDGVGGPGAGMGHYSTRGSMIMPGGTGIALIETRRESQGRFWQRKLEEDAMLNEKLYANAAVRMKEHLLQQITELEEKLKQEKLNRIKDREDYVYQEKGIELREQILTSEIVRAHKELALLQNAYVKLKVEARNAKSAYQNAQKTISEMHSPNDSRLNTAGKLQSKLESLDFRPTSSPLQPQPPPSAHPFFDNLEEFNENTVYFDDENPATDENRDTSSPQYENRERNSPRSKIPEDNSLLYENRESNSPRSKNRDTGSPRHQNRETTPPIEAQEFEDEGGQYSQKSHSSKKSKFQSRSTSASAVPASTHSSFFLQEEGSGVADEEENAFYGSGDGVGGVASDGGSIDYLGFLGVAEHEESESVAERKEERKEETYPQRISPKVGKNRSIQCDPNELEKVVSAIGTDRSAQFDLHDLPPEWGFQTNSEILENEMIQRKEQLIVQEKQLNDYLSDFYENIQLIIYEFFPRQKLDLLQFDYEKYLKGKKKGQKGESISSWQQELQDLDLLSSLDIHWQVKQTLILLVTLNELRNQFVEQLFSIHPLNKKPPNYHPASSVESAETYFQEQLVITFQFQCTMVIHIVDIIIQSIHHLLSPVYHVQRSEYPDIQRILTLVEQKDQLFNISEIASQHLQKQNQHYAGNALDLKTQAEILSKYRESMLGGMHGKDTFPLTQTYLTTDLGYGLRRGGLGQAMLMNISPRTSPQGPGAAYFPPGYMNRSTSPRTLPAYIDQFLDRIEGRSRSRSPSPVKEILGAVKDRSSSPDGKKDKEPSETTKGNKLTSPTPQDPNSVTTGAKQSKTSINASPGRRVNIDVPSRSFSATTGNPKTKRLQFQQQVQNTKNYQSLIAGSNLSSLSNHPLDENQSMTMSISDSFINLSQSPVNTGVVEGEEEDNELMQLNSPVAVRFFIERQDEGLIESNQNKNKSSNVSTKKTNTSLPHPAKPYPHYYFSAKHGKVTTSTGLKSLLSTKQQQQLLQLQNPVEITTEPTKQTTKDEIIPIQPPPKDDDSYLDYIRLPFSADSIESNPYGGKVQSKQPKPSTNRATVHIPQTSSYAASTMIGGKMQFPLQNTIRDTSSTILPQQTDKMKLEVNAFSLGGRGENFGIIEPQKQQDKARVVGRSALEIANFAGLASLSEESVSMFEKSSSIVLMSEVPSVQPRTYPSQAGELPKGIIPQVARIISNDEVSTIPSLTIQRPSGRFKENDLMQAQPARVSFKQPQVPSNPRPTSATQQAPISRTQKNLQQSELSTSRPPSSNSPQKTYRGIGSTSSSATRYYVPSIQQPLFGNKAVDQQTVVEPEELKIVHTEMRLSVSAGDNPQSPPLTNLTNLTNVSTTGPTSLDGLSIAGHRANSSGGNNREKVTNAVLYM